MGMWNSVKNAVTGGSDGDEVDEIIDEVNEEIELEDDPVEEDEEVLEIEDGESGEPEEWDSAYDFAVEMLEYRGFSSGKDFVTKVMFDEISKSPMYRDRIESGTQTMSQIAQAKQTLQSVKGGGGKEANLEKMADKVENANRVIKSIESLEGKEEKMYEEIIGVAQQGVSALAERNAMQGSVESSVEEVDEEL